MKKHRHKWELNWVDAGTLGKGLLYHCGKCSSCKEFDIKTANIQKVKKAYDKIVEILLESLKKKGYK
jgi:hypothetical protein